MSPDKNDKRYWAFISYSSKDAKWGRWLHRRLENYPIPKEFRGNELFDGAVLGKDLKPCFRDRDELSGSSDLGPAIAKALKDTRYLIVLCSPNSAKSEWVNKEIEDFRNLHPDNNRYILALILDGEPNATSRIDADSNLECFPPALQYPHEPLAGDMRKDGDGKERGFLKVIAGISQIGFDQLFRRHEKSRRKKQLTLGIIALAVIASLTALSLVAVNQRNLADQSAQNEKLARLESEKQKEIAISERAKAVENEIRARTSLSQSDYRLAARYLNLGDPRRAFAHLHRSLKNNPASFNAAQLLWTAICRENVRFPSNISSLEVHNGAFDSEGTRAALLTEDGEFFVASTKTGDIRQVVSMKGDWANDLGTNERILIQGDRIILKSYLYGNEESIIVDINSGAITKASREVTFSSNSGTYSDVDTDDLPSGPAFEKHFSNAESIEDLVLDYITANDEESMIVPNASGELLRISGRPVSSILFLKEIETLIVIREGGHSQTRLIEAINLRDNQRYLLAKGARAMKINCAVTPDHKYLVIQSGEEVNLMKMETFLNYPESPENLDATASVVRFPKTATSMAKLVATGELRAASFKNSNTLQLVTTTGLMEYLIPAREEQYKPTQPAHHQLIAANTPDVVNAEPDAGGFRTAELLPLLVENRLENEIPTHSLHLLATSRKAKLLEIRRSVFDEPHSRLITVSNDKDLILDPGFSGDTVSVTPNGNLAAVSYPRHPYVFWKNEDDPAPPEFIFWCPIPSESQNPEWLADFTMKYSGVRIDDDGMLIEERPVLDQLRENSSFSKSWKDLATRFSYQAPAE
ncbi:MAG: toll/interleukin-1 receptor domain-containing protein [Luteolibacter sp.]